MACLSCGCLLSVKPCFCCPHVMVILRHLLSCRGHTLGGLFGLGVPEWLCDSSIIGQHLRCAVVQKPTGTESLWHVAAVGYALSVVAYALLTRIGSHCPAGAVAADPLTAARSALHWVQVTCTGPACPPGYGIPGRCQEQVFSPPSALAEVTRGWLSTQIAESLCTEGAGGLSAVRLFMDSALDRWLCLLSGVVAARWSSVHVERWPRSECYWEAGQLLVPPSMA